VSRSNTGIKEQSAFSSHSISHTFYPFSRFSLILVLLLYIRLRTSLLRLSDVVLVLGSSLGLTVAGNTSNGASNGTSNTVGNTASEVVDLALGFLALACGVLLLTFMLQ
jgi:hypothetical protein